MEKDIREISTIAFGVSSSEHVKRMAVCKIDSTKMAGPEAGTVYDPAMGPCLDNITKPCQTCGENYEVCPGHFGYIHLNYPIIHPLFCKAVAQYLRCFCYYCHRLLFTKEYLDMKGISKYKGMYRFNKIQDILEKKSGICCRCNKIQPDHVYSQIDGTFSVSHSKKDDSGVKKSVTLILTTEDIANIFDDIPNEDVELLGIDYNNVHPRNFIVTYLPVIPPCARPPVLADGNSSDDDLTKQYIEIIKKNNDLLDCSQEELQKRITDIKFHIDILFDNTKIKSKINGTNREKNTLKSRLSGKHGLTRGNLMGKRCLAKGTRVIKWSGEYCNVEDIKLNDYLIDDTGKRRRVISTTSGMDDLYTVNCEYSSGLSKYTVNSEHILSLKYIEHLSVDWEHEGKLGIYSTTGKWVLKWFDRTTLTEQTFKVSVNEDEDGTTEREALNIISEFKTSIDDNPFFDIPVKTYLSFPSYLKSKFVGYKLLNNIEWGYTKVEIDAYIFGYLLINSYSDGVFYCDDQNIIDYIKLKCDIEGNRLQQEDDTTFVIKNLNNFCSRYIKNKHIPDIYIHNDKTLVRLKLLAGILDACVIPEKLYDFYTNYSKYLYKLVHSLGYDFKIKENKMYIAINDKNEIPLLLSNWLVVYKEQPNTCKISVFHSGVNEFYGFELESVQGLENRFLLSDFTVTHNCNQTARTVIGPDPSLRMNEIGIPQVIADTLTVPVPVNSYNYSHLMKVVNEDSGANFITNLKGARINLQYALYKKGTQVLHGDIILRNGKEIPVRKGTFYLQDGDKLIRNGSEVKDLELTQKRTYQLQIGEIVHRKLQKGDIVLLNRQPTLHAGSMMAMRVVPRRGPKSQKNITMNLAVTKSYNGDFDKNCSYIFA